MDSYKKQALEGVVSELRARAVESRRLRRDNELELDERLQNRRDASYLAEAVAFDEAADLVEEAMKVRSPPHVMSSGLLKVPGRGFIVSVDANLVRVMQLKIGDDILVHGQRGTIVGIESGGGMSTVGLCLRPSDPAAWDKLIEGFAKLAREQPSVAH